MAPAPTTPLASIADLPARVAVWSGSWDYSKTASVKQMMDGALEVVRSPASLVMPGDRVLLKPNSLEAKGRMLVA